MDTLIIIVLVLIGILSLIYLIRNNSIENYLIEKFSQRNSLSTYFQTTENSSKLIDNYYSKNRYNNNNTIKKDYNILENNKWNGVWQEDTTSPLYSSFLTVNDKIVFAISKTNFELDESYQKPTNDECISNSFVGIGMLNNSKNNFILTNIICNNLGTSDYIFNEKETTGSLISNGEIIKIYTSNGQSEITFSKLSDFDYYKQSAYLFLSSYVNPIPRFQDSYKIDTDVCNNSNFGSNDKELKACYIDDYGLVVPGNDGVRNYGTGCSSEISEEDNLDTSYNMCSKDTEKTCFIPGKSTDAVGNYPRCDTKFTIIRKYQSNLGNSLTKLGSSGNNLLLCDYLKNFYNIFNSAIVMYVDNLSEVKSLGYEYFGQKNSSLTSNTDIMQGWVEKNVLSKLRDFILDSGTSDINLEKSLRMTNCIENNNSDNTYENILNSCQESFSELKNESKDNSNNTNMPTVWKVNINTQNDQGYYNNQNSCTFSLSSSEWYMKESRWVKYAEFDPMNNSTKMGLYEGGTNQHLLLENANIISSYTDDTDDTGSDIIGNYTLISGNLRTSNPKKYLVPSIVQSGFKQKTTTVNLQNKPRSNGKWLILGFSLMKNMDTISPTSLNNNVLEATLLKIKRNLENIF